MGTATLHLAVPQDALTLVHTGCCLCHVEDGQPIAVGEDFEYRTSDDAFLAMRCRRCGLIYLDPRPTESELDRIYPPHYHAYDFSAARFGLVYRVRQRLEAHRVLRWCRDLRPDARIIDVGCGDGFHLRLLRDYGAPAWRLEGIDASHRAVQAAARAGLTVHLGTVENTTLPSGQYDLALVIAAIEHVAHPVRLMTAVRSLLRPGGRAVIVTDNTDTLDFRIFGARSWGGYHFPRHWHLFNRRTIGLLADRSGFEVERVTTQVSPVNWVYSIRNMLVDWHAPPWLAERFSLRSPVSLAAFTAVDSLFQCMGSGALLRATFRRPLED